MWPAERTVSSEGAELHPGNRLILTPNVLMQRCLDWTGAGVVALLAELCWHYRVVHVKMCKWLGHLWG